MYYEIDNLTFCQHCYTTLERSLGGYIGITLSVRLSVQICVRFITFIWFDIGLPYLAHGSITMRQCVVYIHDPNTTLTSRSHLQLFYMFSCPASNYFFYLKSAYHIWHMCLSPWEDMSCTYMMLTLTFDLKVKLKGFLCLRVRPVSSVCFDIGIPYLTNESITMRGCVMYIHDFDVDLWPQDQIYRVHDIALCSGHIFFSFDIVILCLTCECITRVWWVAYFHGHCMNLTFDLNIKMKNQNYIFTMNLSLARLSLLFDILGIPNFGIWVYHHEPTCCVHSWPLYDLELWHLYMGDGGILSEFYYVFKICR